MIEIEGDLFAPPLEKNINAIVLTTNGIVRADGAAVMGRGVAQQAVARWPGIEFRLGELLRTDGNKVHRLTVQGAVALGADMGRKYKAIPCSPNRKYWRQSSIEVPYDIFSLPVKYHWHEKADLELIESSLHQLKEATAGLIVALPRPGCGNGGLDWETVRPLVARILDEKRFIIIERCATTYPATEDCAVCGGSGFNGRGTGYDDVCGECVGGKVLKSDLPDNTD